MREAAFGGVPTLCDEEDHVMFFLFQALSNSKEAFALLPPSRKGGKGFSSVGSWPHYQIPLER